LNAGLAVTGSALTPPPVPFQTGALGYDDKRAFANRCERHGNLAAEGANTFTGGTTVNAGTLSVGGTSATLGDLNGTVSMSSSGSIINRSGNNAVTLNPTAPVPNQSNAYTGTTMIAGGTLSLTPGSSTTFGEP